MTQPGRAIITESSTRDGLQSLGAFVPTPAKAGLIRELHAAGLNSFDAVSFVNPKAVPQMADGAEVIAASPRDGTMLYGLVPNRRGLEKAVAAGVDGIGCLTAASDTFNQRNINATVAEAMDRIKAILADAPPSMTVRAYVSTITHCPYEGPTDPGRVVALAETLIEWGCDEVFLGETIGQGTVGQVGPLLEHLLERVPVEKVGVHFHDTYGQALANLSVSLDAGVARIDSSAGGLGGCPYAPGAAGNVATEDVVWLLNGRGIDHGVDANAVAAVAADFCERHGLQYQSKAGRAALAAAREDRE